MLWSGLWSGYGRYGQVGGGGGMQDSFGPFWPNGPFWPCPGLRGGKTQKSAMVTMVALVFGNKSAMVRPMVGLWSLWSGRGGAFGKNEVTIATMG